MSKTTQLLIDGTNFLGVLFVIILILTGVYFTLLPY